LWPPNSYSVGNYLGEAINPPVYTLYHICCFILKAETFKVYLLWLRSEVCFIKIHKKMLDELFINTSQKSPLGNVIMANDLKMRVLPSLG
jgi:hypothetical protein